MTAAHAFFEASGAVRTDEREATLRWFGARSEADDALARLEQLIGDDPVAFFADERRRPGGAWVDMEAAFTSVELSEEPESLDAYAARLLDDLLVYAMPVASLAFAGHMTSALLSYLPSLAKVLAALNQNVVKVEMAALLHANLKVLGRRGYARLTDHRMGACVRGADRATGGDGAATVPVDVSSCPRAGAPSVADRDRGTAGRAYDGYPGAPARGGALVRVADLPHVRRAASLVDHSVSCRAGQSADDGHSASRHTQRAAATCDDESVVARTTRAR
ncbi:hypothetical protein [Burkholderia pyrrocinia]